MLYSDELVLMAPTMEQLGRRVTEWRVSLLHKVLKVNAGKSKIMVGNSGGKINVNSGKWPCGKGVLFRCSGVCGDFSLVVYGLMCKRCNSTIQDAELAEDLVVDGERYGCVKNVCYLGDTLDVDGGANFAATARIRNGWMKFRTFLPFLTSRVPQLELKRRVYASCVRSSMVYGSESRPLLVDVGLKLERAEMQINRWMCGVTMKDD